MAKLTLDHVMLSSFSKMKVKLAVQVLSRTVFTCLVESGDPGVVGTAMFCQMVTDFFYCSNVRSTTEHERKKNDRIRPYENVDDERLIWMKDTFTQVLGRLEVKYSNKRRNIHAAEIKERKCFCLAKHMKASRLL